MKKLVVFLTLFAFLFTCGFAQQSKGKGKKVVVKEWKTPAKSGVRYLDQQTTYNAKGQKIEQIEYSNYAQKSRTTFEYDANGNCIKQVVYNSKNKVERVRKFEYYSDGSKKHQYNYAPDGKLISSREFEYIFE